MLIMCRRIGHLVGTLLKRSIRRAILTPKSVPENERRRMKRVSEIAMVSLFLGIRS